MMNTRFRFQRLLAAMAMLSLAAHVGCSLSGGEPGSGDDTVTGRREPKRAPEDAVPMTVALAAGEAASGFASGVLRRNVNLPAFAITKHPITRAEYEQCVEAGACEATRGGGCTNSAYQPLRGRRNDEPESPQLCVTVSEAQSYCGWVGGRLPTLSEWLYAARGKSPARYPWGNDEPTCDQHPRAADTRHVFASDSDEAAQEAGCVPASEARLVVGEYPDGAAKSGMEDVLLTPAELLAPERGGLFPACSVGFAGCFVYERGPGELDAVHPIAKQSAGASGLVRAPLAYGFRCVMEEN